MSAEQSRLDEAREHSIAWRKWGPYLSERQWGTVREDYSEYGTAWDYFPHDQARSRAYRWGEDGLAGISDEHQILCFAMALWNGNDPILKERLFGLTGSEGNHGEDVKEYYFYLDSTPTHSYMKYLYKYSQASYPYGDLVETNRRRGRDELEYELLDTGIFDGDRYFDVFVEYAKAASEDVLIKFTVYNRGAETASLHLLPTVWFRNTWSWQEGGTKPTLRAVSGVAGSVLQAQHNDPLFLESLDTYYLYCDDAVPLLFTENETNNVRVFGTDNLSPYVKDGINDYVVHGRHDTVNPEGTGTKAAAHYPLTVGAGDSAVVRLRLTRTAPEGLKEPFQAFDAILDTRRDEADAFYDGVMPPTVRADPDRANVMRQALAGMLWTKQYYYFDGNRWLNEHDANPLRPGSRYYRNQEWVHMVNDDIISMPDKWEYPWYAAWDLAFHTVALAVVDPEFAKKQLDLLLNANYLHPNGQIPAYEWAFGDVNPPVHAWATLFLTRLQQTQGGSLDADFLASAFHKLSLNFAWWANRKDRSGKNLFEGGFLGLDNISVFDRSAPLPTGGYLEQADGTAWMAFFCQNMAELAIELAAHDRQVMYQQAAAQYVDRFLWIAAAMNRPGDGGMWDEEDGFYYDVLQLPDGSATRLKVRSLVGLLPLCATTVIERRQRDTAQLAVSALQARVMQLPELLNTIHPTGQGHLGVADRGIIALLNQERLRRVLTRMLDENEFLSPHGIRSISRFHADHPYTPPVGGSDFRVEYLAAESNTGMFGGNSNWRGPVWFPINTLIIRALLSFYLYYGDDFKIECPTGSGQWLNLFEVARELAERLTGIFLRAPSGDGGRRPVYGGTEKFQTDPHWRDYILFYEYFHGDNGAGIGASHQTGWTGLAAPLIQLFGSLDGQQFLEMGKQGLFTQVGVQPQRGGVPGVAVAG